MNELKLCKDCKYNHSYQFEYSILCKHPNNGIDLTTGKPKSYFCAANRASKSLCGEEGKWFEPKEEVGLKLSFINKVIKFFKGDK